MILLPSDWVLPALQRMPPGLWLPFYEQGDMLLQCVGGETLVPCYFSGVVDSAQPSKSVQPF